MSHPEASQIFADMRKFSRDIQFNTTSDKPESARRSLDHSLVLIGLVYQHPLLPKPVLAFEPTFPVDISLFETGAGFSIVRDSMVA